MNDRITKQTIYLFNKTYHAFFYSFFALRKICWPLKGPFCVPFRFYNLFGRGVFGDSLCSFRDGMFGQLSRQQQTDSSLDLPRGDGSPLVVMSQSRRFRSDPLEHIIHKRVHDGHGFGGDSSVRMDLFQHLVDVDGVRFLPLLPSLFPIPLGDVLLGFPCLLGSLSAHFWWHDDTKRE